MCTKRVEKYVEGQGGAPGPQPWRGLQLGSAFQPILSLSHGRLVGWEALLRAQRPARPGQPGALQALPPAELFAGLGTTAERQDLDLHALRAHLRNFSASPAAVPGQWLFLNLDPASLVDGAQQVLQAVAGAGLPAERVVIEVLEAPWGLDAGVREGVASLRAMGCLIALDDFGAGHSNFERVFELQPHIVKLDRHVLLRAKQGPRQRRIVAQMVALLHECGALVLMEGVETLEGAHIALGCDVDLVQGWFFGRPQPEARALPQHDECLSRVWRTFDAAEIDGPRDVLRLLQPQRDALAVACDRLALGLPMADACTDFLRLPATSACFLLDGAGEQVGDTAFRRGHSHQTMGEAPQFAPLYDCRGANWSRRGYFRRAVRQPRVVQVTRPYLTLQGGRMCRTLSMAFEAGGQLRVLCADLDVPDEQQPTPLLAEA